jgi:uncharacterized protein YjbI with pentapeptide repeats
MNIFSKFHSINKLTLFGTLMFLSFYSISARLGPSAQITPTTQPVNTIEMTPSIQPTKTVEPILEIPNLSNIKMDDLEKYKIILETNKLKKDLESFDLSPFLQTGTLVSAFLALIISIITSNKSSKMQMESLNSQQLHNEKERVSELLKELGSDSMAVKIASMQALREYKTAYPFISNILRVETDQTCIDVAIRILLSEPEISLPILLEETRKIHTYEMNLATRLVTLGLERKKVASNLYLNNSELQDWIDNKYRNRINQLTELSINNQIHLYNLSEDEIIEKEKKYIFQELEILLISKNNIITAIEEVIKAAVNKGIVLNIQNAFLNNIVLNDIDLSGCSFSNSTLNGANFEKSNCTKTDFSSIKARELNLRNCELQEANFSNSKLKKCNFKSTTGKKVNFFNSEIYEPIFESANHKNTNFTNSRLIKMSFRNTLFVKSNFIGAKIHQCDISACDLSGSNFCQSTISTSSIMTARLRDIICDKSKIFKVDINRSSFDNASMKDCVLRKINSINSNFVNVDFTGTRFDNVQFDINTDTTGIILNNIVTHQSSLNKNNYKNC